MRDVLVTLLVCGALPFCLKRPSIGVLLFSWLSYMNPHRLTWGFAYELPFAQIVALATLIGLLVSRESKQFPMNAPIVIWLILLLWMCITTLFAFHPDAAWEGFVKMAKIQIMVFVTLLVMGTKERMVALVWVITLSIAFYGAKGGIFAILTGGEHRVWGPEGSFIADNNSLALALIMTLPLLRFLQLRVTQRYMKWGLGGILLLTGLAVLATQSRGALVGLCTMSLFLWLKSSNKIAIGVALVILSPIAFYSMPESWHERMQTIQNYEEDGSAMGRITVWRYTVELANSRLTAGGFRGIESDYGYKRYAPEIYEDVMSTHGHFRAAHSIWFGMLGQHGWPGLMLFVLLGWTAWRNGTWVIRHAKGRPELQWSRDLASMLQVCMVGYASTGTFLSMEYFDYYYHVLALLVLLQAYVRNALRDESPEEATAAVRSGTIRQAQAAPGWPVRNESTDRSRFLSRSEFP